MAVEPEILKDFVRDQGLTPKQNSVSYIFDCPRCGKAKKLYIRKRDGKFRCWYCYSVDGFGGNAEFALSTILGIPLQRVRAALYLEESMPEGVDLNTTLLDWYDPGEETDIEAEPLQTLQWPIDYYQLDHKHGIKGVKYLEGRGIPLDIALQYDIRYAPQRQRVVFPVEAAGQLYGWQERLVVPHQFWSEDEGGKWKEILKVVSSKAIPREHTLMFADRLRGSRHAVMLEGPVDALKAHLCGGNVATMGKGVSQLQIGLVRNAGVRRVYLALDPDAGEEAEGLAREFWDLEVYLMDPSPAKDFGERSLEETHDIFQRAPRINSARCFSTCR